VEIVPAVGGSQRIQTRRCGWEVDVLIFEDRRREVKSDAKPTCRNRDKGVPFTGSREYCHSLAVPEKKGGDQPGTAARRCGSARPKTSSAQRTKIYDADYRDKNRMQRTSWKKGEMELERIAYKGRNRKGSNYSEGLHRPENLKTSDSIAGGTGPIEKKIRLTTARVGTHEEGG